MLMLCFVVEYSLWLILAHMHIVSEMLVFISFAGTGASRRCWRHVVVGSIAVRPLAQREPRVNSAWGV